MLQVIWQHQLHRELRVPTQLPVWRWSLKLPAGLPHHPHLPCLSMEHIYEMLGNEQNHADQMKSKKSVRIQIPSDQSSSNNSSTAEDAETLRWNFCLAEKGRTKCWDNTVVTCISYSTWPYSILLYWRQTSLTGGPENWETGGSVLKAMHGLQSNVDAILILRYAMVPFSTQICTRNPSNLSKRWRSVLDIDIGYRQQEHSVKHRHWIQI